MSESILFTRTNRAEHPPHLSVEMSAQQFSVMQRDSLTYDNLTLTSLAEQNPQAAYDRFRRIISHIITISEANAFTHQKYEEELFGGDVRSIVNEENSILRPRECSDRQVEEARDYMLSMLPDSPYDAFDLSVDVRLNDDEAELFVIPSINMLDFSFRKSPSADQA